MPLPNRALPSRDYLLACFAYDPLTGVLTWRTRPREHFKTAHAHTAWNAKLAGKAAGSFTPLGYRQVAIGRVPYKAHRIIWKMMTGDEPPETLDHRDHDASNNRGQNLRPATQTEQNWNTALGKDNACQRSVYRVGRRWRATIHSRGRRFQVGYFDTVEEAAAAYEDAARVVVGEFRCEP